MLSLKVKKVINKKRDKKGYIYVKIPLNKKNP